MNKTGLDACKLLPLFVSKLKGVGKKEKIEILKWISGQEDLNSVSQAEFSSFVKHFFRSGIDTALIAGESVSLLERCMEKKISVISVLDPDYPPLLEEIFDPPAVLFYRGSRPDPSGFCLSIVGTRHASGRALRASFETAFLFSLSSVNVVSGLALGIDAEAHKGAAFSGGKTTAVLGCGVDVVYPKANRRTAEIILESGGTIVSEYEPGTMPLKYHFPERNRIISGLSAATIVIEAPEGSGALITADYALEQGRDVFLHSAGLLNRNRCGAGKLADDGAPVFDDPSAVLDFYGRLEKENTIVVSENFFEDPYYVEYEIEEKIINYKGVLYRRAING